jgi:hypothetical protein
MYFDKVRIKLVLTFIVFLDFEKGKLVILIIGFSKENQKVRKKNLKLH